MMKASNNGFLPLIINLKENSYVLYRI